MGNLIIFASSLAAVGLTYLPAMKNQEKAFDRALNVISRGAFILVSGCIVVSACADRIIQRLG